MKIMVLFLGIQILIPFSVAIAEEHEKVIVISEEVGEVIDVEERDHYQLFPQIEGFKSAVFLKLPDGSFAAEVTYREEGEEKKRRIPQSKKAIASLKDYIEHVSIGKISPLASEEEEKHVTHTKGELVTISDRVGEYIDLKESKECNLFSNIRGFKRATFYTRRESGFLIEIQTESDTLTSVVLDTEMVMVLGNYIERHWETVPNWKDFEKKWKIIGYDMQGIPITLKEEVKFQKQGFSWTPACCLGGGILGGGLGCLFMIPGIYDAAWNDEHIDSTPLFISVAAGGLAGALVGRQIDGKFDKDPIAQKISALRAPRRKK